MIKRIISSLLVGLISLVVALPGQAAMVGTAQIQQEQNLLAIDLQSISQKRDWLREQLVLGGVDTENASLRVAAMTDLQVNQIYQRIDAEPAGGVNVLLVILIVFLVTELTGYTDVIPGVGPGK